VFRGTLKGKLLKDAVMVASLRSRANINQFSLLSMYLAAYYNNALLAPESRSETGGAFIALTRDWPYYYKMMVVNDETMKHTAHLGFDTNARTRTPAFELVKTEIGESHISNHNFRHRYLLNELSAAIKGKKGRPDHTRDGTLDCGIAYAIKCWVWAFGKEQLRCNRGTTTATKTSSWETRIRETKPIEDNKQCIRMGYGQ